MLQKNISGEYTLGIKFVTSAFEFLFKGFVSFVKVFAFIVEEFHVPTPEPKFWRDIFNSIRAQARFSMGEAGAFRD